MNYIEEIFLFTDHVVNSTSSKKIMKKKILIKEQFLARRLKNACIASLC